MQETLIGRLPVFREPRMHRAFSFFGRDSGRSMWRRIALAPVALSAMFAATACDNLRTTTTTTREREGEITQVQTKGWIETLVPVVGIALTLLAASGAIWWNLKNNRWKRREYIVNAFQQRWDSPGAKNASFLLYWKDRHIPLWADDEKYRWERVQDEEAAMAILPYVVHPFDFSDVRTAADWKTAKRRIALNDSFVDLIWRLDHVRVISGAANRDDVREVIHEMGEIISGSPRGDRLAVPGRLLPPAFRLMIAWRGMNELIEFFDRNGYDIRFTERDHQQLSTAFPRLDWDALPYDQIKRKLPLRASV